MSRFCNVTAVVILLAIAGLIFFMPKFNYEILLARQARVETALNTLVDRTAKIERVVDVATDKRSAGLKWIDDLPPLVERLQGRLAEVADVGHSSA